jgi:alpha-tubulin suppressor-like RCC1 family protein
MTRFRVGRLATLLSVAMAIGGVTSDDALASGTAAVAWGHNHSNQLGVGYLDNYEVSPRTVVGLTNITALVAAGNSSFALVESGTEYSWGRNEFGELGNGSVEGAATPTAIGGFPEGVKAISASSRYAMALLDDGEVMAWGGGSYGEQGNGTSQKEGKKTHSYVPKVVPGLEHVIAISSGGSANFALEENGTLMAWGRDKIGMLGLGKAAPEMCEGEEGEWPCSPTPAAVDLENVPIGVKVIGVTAGEEAAYALLSNGSVLAWGHNEHATLGNGGTEVPPKNTDVPTAVLNLGEGHLGRVIAVAAGNIFALALLEDGEVAGWGSNEQGELGGTSSEECGVHHKHCQRAPRLVSELKEVSAISAGESFSFALSHGTVYALGDNEHGLLGLGTTEGNVRVPTAIEEHGLASIGGVAAGVGEATGEAHSLAFVTSGPGPAPLLSLTPKESALEVVWRVSASEDKLRWKTAETSAETKQKEKEAEEDYEKAAAAEASGESEAAAKFREEAKQREKEAEKAEEEEHWSAIVKVKKGAEAEACGPEKACSYVIHEYLGEPLHTEPYRVQLRLPGKAENRGITGTPLP